MLHSSDVPVFPAPARPVWPSDRPLISQEEWQALLCQADALPWVEGADASDMPSAESVQRSLS